MTTRTQAPSQRGFSLIESMIAIAIILLSATGLAATYVQGVNMTGDARRMTQATAIAQDLVNNIAYWTYSEAAGAPLANVTTANDADIGDTAHAFQTVADPLGSGLADHGEADLTAMGTAWTGVPQAELNGVFQRYWSVAYLDSNGDGVNDMAQIAVIVRWQQGGGWRRVVLLTAKLNPAAN
jgi:prepilin-type N-terminal cleavage/methylation domain-containing protein